VDVHLTSLRKKIERAGGESDLLETVRGVGYRIRERT
jgi:DNA-binding response OmpR family regulator